MVFKLKQTICDLQKQLHQSLSQSAQKNQSQSQPRAETTFENDLEQRIATELEEKSLTFEEEVAPEESSPFVERAYEELETPVEQDEDMEILLDEQTDDKNHQVLSEINPPSIL